MKPSSELYDSLARGYSRRRRSDPRIGRLIAKALGPTGSVVNVGAGTGSYEPEHQHVIAVDPSIEMLRRRDRSTPAIVARAESLPLHDDATDSALAILTIHHWVDKRAGLAECGRVARGRLVVLTWDPDSEGFWLVRDYFPEILATDRQLFPRLGVFEEQYGAANVVVEQVPIPADCVDGFLGAYWRRPAAYLDPEVRGGMSSFARVPIAQDSLVRLADDIASGNWARKYGALLQRDELDIGYRLLTIRLG